MKTWRVCAAIGLGLSFAIASGCSSDSSPKNDGGGKRDVSAKRDVFVGRDTTVGEPCTTASGQTYQVGEAFTYDCVRFICQGGNNIIQVSGSPCSDAGPDARTGDDVAAVGPEVGRSDGGDASRDVVLAETAKQDGRPPADIQAVDLEPREDTAPPAVDTIVPEEDTAVPEEDTAVPAADLLPGEDLPPPVQCTYAGQKYGVGVPFPCECNTCKCDSTGTVVLVTNRDCTIDAS